MEQTNNKRNKQTKNPQKWARWTRQTRLNYRTKHLSQSVQRFILSLHQSCTVISCSSFPVNDSVSLVSGCQSACVIRWSMSSTMCSSVWWSPAFSHNVPLSFCSVVHTAPGFTSWTETMWCQLWGLLQSPVAPGFLVSQICLHVLCTHHDFSLLFSHVHRFHTTSWRSVVSPPSVTSCAKLSGQSDLSASFLHTFSWVQFTLQSFTLFQVSHHQLNLSSGHFVCLPSVTNAFWFSCYMLNMSGSHPHAFSFSVHACHQPCSVGGQSWGCSFHNLIQDQSSVPPVALFTTSFKISHQFHQLLFSPPHSRSVTSSTSCFSPPHSRSVICSTILCHSKSSGCSMLSLQMVYILYTQTAPADKYLRFCLADSHNFWMSGFCTYKALSLTTDTRE